MNGSASSGGRDVNDVSGYADAVVQSGVVHGGVHFHHHSETRVLRPRVLPPTTKHFTGRDGALAGLDQSVQARASGSSDAEVSIVTGTAGVGKTTLVIQWAHHARERFPDGELYVDLRGYKSGPAMRPEQALHGFLRTLGVAPEWIPGDLEEQARLYRFMLDDRRMLIVLDNARTSEQVLPFLPGSGGSHVVVTSRNRLTRLVTIYGAHRITLDILTPRDALDLLRRVLGSERVEQERSAAEELVRRCGYLPLALMIVAERALISEYITFADLNVELGGGRGRLDALVADDDFPEMRTVISWSYGALNTESAKFFRLLGAHPGQDISADAAAALAVISSVRARRLLNALAEVHLIDEIGRDRYQFHDLLRDYAAERFQNDEPEDERRIARSRLLSWYLRTSYMADELVRPAGDRPSLDSADKLFEIAHFVNRESALTWYGSERGNILDVIHDRASFGDPGNTWKLAQLITPFLQIRGWFLDCLIVAESALRDARSTHDKAAEAWGLDILGEAHRYLRKFEDAKEYWGLALPISREFGDRRLEGFCHLGIGGAFRGLGLLEDAIRHIKQALVIFEEAGFSRNAGIALMNLAIIYDRIGKAEKALHCTKETIDRGLHHGDPWLEPATLAILGSAYKETGHLEKSIDCFNSALEAARSISHRVLEAEILILLGQVACELGYVSEACRAWHQALAMADELRISEATYLNTPDIAEVRARMHSLCDQHSTNSDEA